MYQAPSFQQEKLPSDYHPRHQLYCPARETVGRVRVQVSFGANEAARGFDTFKRSNKYVRDADRR